MTKRFRLPALWAILLGSIPFFCQPAFAASSTTTTLTVSPSSTTAGSIITLTASVTSGGVPLTAGQVKFCNASATYCDNGAVLGTVWVTSSGTATLRRALRIGTTNVKAFFQPNNSYSTSTSGTTAVTVTGIDPDTSPLTFLSGGSNAYAIYAGDFNNDGYVDLAVYDTVLRTLQIFLGSSSGTFTKGASLAATDGAYWLVADFNRDGNLDLIDGYSGQVYLGAGNGTFTTGTTLPSTACSGYASYQVAVADVNGDGIPDIVTTCDGYSNIYTLLGNGNGSFSAGPTTNASACFTPAVGIGGFGVGDFNSDGKPDLFVTGYKGTSNSPNACTFLGTGTGTFTRTGSTFTDTGNNSPVAVGDFRNVGYPDVATACEGFEQTLLDNGTYIASFGTTLSYAPLQLADLNGDGNLDYVAVGASKVIGVPGKGNGTFGSATIVAPSPLPGPNSTVIAAGDFYNIGLPAVAITTGTSPSYVEIMPMLKATPPVVVTCAPSAGTFGSSATTCTAQTTAGATGLMSITYNGTAWGSGIVNGSGALSVSGGGGWGAGSYTITATYAGDENFNSASGSMTYTVGEGLTVTQLLSSTPNPSTYGAAVTFSVMVNGNGAMPSPTGSVSFFDGATNLGSASVTSTASTTNLAPYSQQLTTFPWGGYCGATSNETANAVAAPDGTITATEFVMPSTFSCGSGVSWGAIDSIVGGLVVGQSYTTSIWLRGATGGEVVSFGVDDCNMKTFTLGPSWQRYSYTIASYASCEPTRGFQLISSDANITYYAWGAQTEASPSMGPYAATYSASSASGAGAQATFSTTYIPAGAQSITAVYNGDSNWLGSTSVAMVQNVTPAVLTVTASSASKVYGSANPAFIPIYSGFVNGDTSTVLTGSPSLTTTATAASPVGSYTITAAAGTLSAANYSFTFVNGTLTVTKATSVLSVTSSLNPSIFGNTVTFTLTVGGSGSGVVPTGTVAFTEGGTTLLPATAVNASGQATYVTSSLPAGLNTLTLTYSGDTNYF